MSFHLPSFRSLRRAFIAVPAGLVLVVGASTSCSLLVDSKADQCESDADCEAFPGAVCDVATKTCKADTTTTTTTTDTGGTGGTGAVTGGGGTTTMTGGGGTTTTSDQCADPDSPAIEISGDIDANFTLSCKEVYLINGPVHVLAGATLTIEKGTTIKGNYVDPLPENAGKAAVLIIDPGAKLIAVGTEDQPIVFTSSQPAGMQKGADWGGIIVLGNAPTNHKDMNGQTTQGKIEGIVSGGLYGGINDNDNSGTMRYLRIEYCGFTIAPNNEVNGITFGGVGRGTTVDHIQVRHTTDDCFEFFGGTVNAKYLACQYPGDDGFDWDNGYSGKLQFLVLQQNPALAEQTNGFEGDNDAVSSQNLPISNPTIYNATLCGQNGDQAQSQYGLLVRRSTKGSFFNVLATGFETGWDVRDQLTAVSLKNSLFFGNLVNNVAEPEAVGMPSDDDAGFDEGAYFLMVENSNSTANPNLGDCFDPTTPAFGPQTSITANAAAPPSDGFFDPSASYVGAFADANDDWATKGNWPVWTTK